METKVNGKVFTCPECGGHVLEEVMVNVVQSTSILEVVGDSETADPEYGNASSDGGIVERIQCQECGRVIVDDSLHGPGMYETLVELAAKWE